jgi:hypothetical protein
LEGNGEMPSNPLPPSPHQSSQQESGEAPNLGDALDILDQELGFID